MSRVPVCIFVCLGTPRHMLVIIKVTSMCDTESEKVTKIEGKFRNWMITCNNWTQETHETLCNLAGCKYLFQHEIGKEGTPHIQGVLMFKNARTWKQLRDKIGEYWFKPAENIHACKNYCSKVKTRVGDGYFTNIPEYQKKQIKDPLEGKTLYPWQQECLNIVADDPKDRNITWFWEDTGCTGKTSVAKHLCIHNDDCILVGGKAADMKYAVMNMVNKSKAPRVILMNITRTIEDYVSYEGIEAVKDGLFFSGKYESGMCMYDCPHVIIFANFEPKYSAMSPDRWDVHEISPTAPPSTPTASPSPPEGAKSEAKNAFFGTLRLPGRV